MSSVLIFGGGVAGIAASCALADAGFDVTLIEKRPMLGGRASSFADGLSGEVLDECQHGTMRCCTNLTDLLERLGVADKIRYFDELLFLDGEGKRSVIKGCGLPAPFHTSLSFLLFRSLNLRDKIGIGRAMFSMLRSKPSDAWDQQDIACWFQLHGQTKQAMQRFWRPILVSACNDEPERISCTHAFKIFRDGFLAHPTAYHFGIPTVPLGVLYTEPACSYLKAKGGSVRLKSRVETLHFDEQLKSILGVTLQNGETLSADYYISGLQFDLLLKLLPPALMEGIPYWENLTKIELSPIMGVHLWFDRLLDCPPALSLLDRPTEWIFNKTEIFQSDISPVGSYLSLVISASRKYSGMSQEQIVEMSLHDVRACLPDAREAVLQRSRVIRWPKATISPRPGVESLRPGPVSPISNLIVAGEWTDTGWPSTMEGAARSGYRAAECLLAAEGRPQQVIAPDLPLSGFSRFMMAR